jgi:hypothetical protein
MIDARNLLGRNGLSWREHPAWPASLLNRHGVAGRQLPRSIDAKAVEAGELTEGGADDVEPVPAESCCSRSRDNSPPEPEGRLATVFSGHPGRSQQELDESKLMVGPATKRAQQPQCAIWLLVSRKFDPPGTPETEVDAKSVFMAFEAFEAMLLGADLDAREIR